MKRKTKTQTDKVLEYLEQFGTITPAEAFTKIGVYRLGARIFDLRDMGYNIETERISVKTSLGDQVGIARYRLVAE